MDLILLVTTVKISIKYSALELIPRDAGQEFPVIDDPEAGDADRENDFMNK